MQRTRQAEHFDPKIVLFLNVISCSLLSFEWNCTDCHLSSATSTRIHASSLPDSDSIWFDLGNILESLEHSIWFSFNDHKTCSVASMVFPFLTFVALWSVMACLCGISFNLYLLVTRPLRYHTIVTRKRFFCILSGTYLVVVLACGVVFPVPKSPYILLLIEQCQNQLIRQNSVQSIIYAYQALPVCVTMSFTTVIYAKLLFIARQKANEVENLERPRDNIANDLGMDQILAQPQNRADLNFGCNAVRRQRRRFKGLVTILLLTCSFCIAWIPFLFSGIKMNKTLMTIFNFFPLGNNWIQPIVYLLTNPEGRRLFLQFVRCCRANDEPLNWNSKISNYLALRSLKE